MTEIFKRTTLATGLLLLMPLAVMLSGWRWQPGKWGGDIKSCSGLPKPSPDPGEY